MDESLHVQTYTRWHTEGLGEGLKEAGPRHAGHWGKNHYHPRKLREKQRRTRTTGAKATAQVR